MNACIQQGRYAHTHHTHKQTNTKKHTSIETGTQKKKKNVLLVKPKSGGSIADVESAGRLRGFSLIWLPHLERKHRYVDVRFKQGEEKRPNKQRW